MGVQRVEKRARHFYVLKLHGEEFAELGIEIFSGLTHLCSILGS